MAQSFKDSARQLRDKAALQFPAKGAQVTVDGKVWPLDRVYVEAYTASDDTLTKWPTPTKARVPDRCAIGSYHPSDAYLKLVDAYKTGSSDNDSNWQLTYKLDLQLWAANAITAAATAGALTVAFGSGPVTVAPTPATLSFTFSGAAQAGQEHEVSISSGAFAEKFYFADANAMDARVYLGAASGALSTDRAALIASLVALYGPSGSIGVAFASVSTSGSNGIVLVSAASGASAYITVADTGPDALWSIPTATEFGGDATGASSITIAGTGAVTRTFTWAWSDPGGGVTYMGQGNAGAASARNALVAAINAHAPLAAVLTAANVTTQSFSLTSVGTGASAYVSASSSGTDIWTGEGTGTGTAATMQITWPDILVKDGYQKGDEYGDDTSVINWNFEVVNPDAYTAPAKNTAHPTVSTAKLVSETFSRNGPTARVFRRYEKFATLTSHVADDGPGTVSKTESIKVASVTAPTPVAGKVVTKTALGSGFSQLTTSGLISGGERYDYEFHPETRDLITIKREILNTVAAPTQAVKQHVTQQSLNSAWCLRVTRSIAGGGTGGRPTPFEYYKWIDYPVFRLLSGFTIYTFGSEFKIDPVVRSGYTKRHRCRISVDFHETNPSLSTLFEPHTVDIAYDGFTFSVFEQNVITDEWEIDNSGIETYTTPESDPTYTEYLALIGDEVLINEILTPWDFQLIRRTRYYITLE